MAELSSNDLILKLQEQLSVARSEISNLRHQVKSLTYINQKEIKKIESVLNSWKCKKCSQKDDCVQELDENSPDKHNDPDNISFQPIGVVNTDFNQKRGVPRQPGIGCRIHGKITLNNKVFTNPEHALEGLEEFSHMWILFHFHRNCSNHVKAKVSPPRLNGIRTGVFGTRSPHRPCPIGLSLVQISYIEGASIYFSGVDMLDGTPVLDLKPYIPLYDNPLNLMKHIMSGHLEGEENASSSDGCFQSAQSENGQHNHLKDFGEREAPDGEESGEQIAPLPVSVADTSYQIVRVPKWVSDPPVPQLKVTFSKNIEEQLEHNTKEIIKSILREDPRSVYLRERYGNQFYTFLIQELHVSCKFDDTLQTVNVYRVAEAKKLCSCGIPEWQCAQHQAE